MSNIETDIALNNKNFDLFTTFGLLFTWSCHQKNNEIKCQKKISTACDLSKPLSKISKICIFVLVSVFR